MSLISPRTSVIFIVYPLSPLFSSGVVGRYANRIADGHIDIDGESYMLSANETKDGRHITLHGGHGGFDKKIWKLKTFSQDCPKVILLSLEYTSINGEEGFPGNLVCTVNFILRKDENKLKIHYHATTDKKTVVNLSNHSYFNLEGHDYGSILDHEAEIFMDSYIPIRESCIPTGEIKPVKNTPFDFCTCKKTIGKDIDHVDDEQIKFGFG